MDTLTSNLKQLQMIIEIEYLKYGIIIPKGKPFVQYKDRIINYSVE